MASSAPKQFKSNKVYSQVPLTDESDHEEHQPPIGINERIDTTALNGLRGFAALHIMIFHSFYYSKLQINLLGPVQMPLFFLISGYVFAISDGKIKYFPTKCCTELKSFPEINSYSDQDSDRESLKHFDGKHYYQRRIARTIPLYYLTNILCIPLLYSGHGHIQPDITQYICFALTLVVATSWFGKPIFLNGVSWFVSTIWFFYWISPSLLPKLQKYAARGKQIWIIAHYWIQFIGGMGIFIGCFFWNPRDAFFYATFWPPSRLPVFIMGILGGLLRNENIAIKKGLNENIADRLGIMMIIVFVALGLFENIFDIDISIGSALWLQLIIPWWQLQFIAALTYGNGESNAYKILTSKLLLELGRMSYSLYLVHESVIQYICWFLYGKITMPCDETDCSKEWDTWNDKRLMPLWCIPVHLCVSMLIAILLNRIIEEPMRKWLRPAERT